MPSQVECVLCDAHKRALNSGACDGPCKYEDCIAHHILLAVREMGGGMPNDGISILDHIARIVGELKWRRDAMENKA